MSDRTLAEQSLQTRLGQLSQGLEKLEADLTMRSDAGSSDVTERTEAAEPVAALRLRLADAKRNFERLRHEGLGNWEGRRTELEVTLEHLASEIDALTPRFTEK